MSEKIDVVSIMREIQNRADEKYLTENHGYRYEMTLDLISDKKTTGDMVKDLDKEECVDISGLLNLDGDEFVDGLYRVILKRDADIEGKNNAIEFIKSHSKIEAIHSFAESEEAQNKKIIVYGYPEIKISYLLSFDGEDFIKKLYLHVLGRMPDIDGFIVNLSALKTNKLSKVQLINCFSASEEGIAKGVKVVNDLSVRTRLKNNVKTLLKKLKLRNKYLEEIEQLNNRIIENETIIKELEKKVKNNDERYTKLDENCTALAVEQRKETAEIKKLSKENEVVVDKINKTNSKFESDLGATARQVMLAKWMILDNYRQTIEKPEDILECKICGSKHRRSEYNTKESDCIFNGGHLVRYECPDCGVIFGPSKFTAQGQKGIDEDYWVHYLGFSEGDSSYKEERAFRMLQPEMGKLYLNYGCGKWSKTLQKLREEGYQVYGYEPYAPESDNPYLITNKEDLLRMRFDGIFSNDVLEHLLDPVQDLKMMSGLLIDENSKMSHCTACYTYKYEHTRFHVHFFTGNSVEILAEKAGLKIEEYVDDLVENDFYCYVYSPKQVEHNLLHDMYTNKFGNIREDKIVLEEGGLLYGPYYTLGSGQYILSAIVSDVVSGIKYKITCNDGNTIISEGELHSGENEVSVSLAETTNKIEFIILNSMNETVVIDNIKIRRR